MQRRCVLTLTGVLFLYCLAPLSAQPSVRIGSVVFADYFYKLGGDSVGLPAQYAPYREHTGLFQFRRVQLWAESFFGAGFSARVLLEANDLSLDAQRRYSPFLKEVSLTWDSLALDQLQLQAGLIPTPTWRLSEALWSYRSLEKTVTDFWGWGSAVDFGVALRARSETSNQRVFQALLMLGSGEGVRAESNSQKKLYAECFAQPLPGFWLEAYADWESRAPREHILQFKGLLGYQHASFSAGGELLLRSQHRADTVTTPLGLSLFGHWQLAQTPSVRLVLRYDWVKRENSPASVHHFGLVAIDYAPIPQVHCMPNLWLLGRKALRPQIVPRITLFVRSP